MKTVDKEKAKTLRQMGLNYQDIANEIGCSLDWCKRNLKGVPKGSKEDQLKRICVDLAKQPRGVDNYTLIGEIIKVFPEHFKDNSLTDGGLLLLKRLKYHIKKEEGTLIRPTWLKPHHADDLFTSIIKIVDNLDRRMDEEIMELIDRVNPEKKEISSMYKSIERQVFMLSSFGRQFHKQNIPELIASLEKTVEELKKRCPDVQKKVTYEPSLLDISDESLPY